MFPQLPFGFQNNVKKYGLSCSVALPSIVSETFIGVTKNATTATDLTIIKTTVSITELKTSESLLITPSLTTTAAITEIKQSTSSIVLDNIKTATDIQRNTGGIGWVSITDNEWFAINENQWRSIN